MGQSSANVPGMGRLLASAHPLHLPQHLASSKQQARLLHLCDRRKHEQAESDTGPMREVRQVQGRRAGLAPSGFRTNATKRSCSSLTKNGLRSVDCLCRHLGKHPMQRRSTAAVITVALHTQHNEVPPPRDTPCRPASSSKPTKASPRLPDSL